MKKIITVIAAFSCITLSAQRKYTIDNAGWFNPWIGSGNMAALKGNSAFLQDAGGSVSEAALSFDGSAGEYRNIYDPVVKLDGTLNVESFLEVDKVNLYGRFNYNYDYGSKSTWRGAVRPYESPFMLADSIPGNTTMETYSMEAGISVPVGKWAIGMDVSYDVAIFAKLKDLRNRNTDMTFRIAPSLVYNAKHFDIGLHAGYELGSEKVEYAKIADNAENYLFYLYGLWMNTCNSFANAENSRLNDKGRWFGGIQFDVKYGGWTLFNMVSADWGRASQTETGYNNLLWGDTESFRISDRLVFQNGIRHRLTAAVSSEELTGERFLQRQELDPASSVRRWVTYGSPMPCYARYVLSGSLDYTFRKAERADYIPWELSVGATDMMAAHQYVNYPLTYLQKINYIEPYASFTGRIYLKKCMLDFNPTLSYKVRTSSIMDDVTVSEGAVVSGDPQAMQLMEPLQAEFDWWDANCLRAGLKLGIEAGRFFGGISYRYDFAHIVRTGSFAGRHNANITIGISF